MNNYMTKIIDNLFTSIVKEEEDNYRETLKNLAKSLKEDSTMDFTNPEHFDLFFNNKVNRYTNLLPLILREESSYKFKHKVSFIYNNYSFLKNHIEELCIKREGVTCCVDKSIYILKMYLNYSITGDIPSFDPEVENHYSPNFGDNEQWIAYCEGLYSLYYGKVEAYLNAYNNLLKTTKRLYKHLLHTWHLRLLDGTVVKIGTTWDNKVDNPFNYHKRDDYYIIKKSLFEIDKFEIYEPINETERFLYGKNYVKVYIKEIDSFYYETEEKMI